MASRAVNPWAYTLVFRNSTWLCIFIQLIIFWCILAKVQGHFSDAILEVLSSALQISYLHTRYNGVAEKLFFIAMAFFTRLIFFHYTADLTSKMTVQDRPFPIQKFGQVLDQNMKMLHLRGSIVDIILQKSPAGRVTI